MVKDRTSMPMARRIDWNHKLATAPRLGASPKPVESKGAGVGASGRHDRSVSFLKSIPARPLSRTHALWLLAGALWISIGMIVSATLVTVAFLA
jgi:hypothetical protein